MSDWREFAYEADRDSGIEYGGEDFDTEIRRFRARIRELEERLHERDLAVAALAQRCDELSVALSKRQHSVTWHDAGDEHP